MSKFGKLDLLRGKDRLVRLRTSHGRVKCCTSCEAEAFTMFHVKLGSSSVCDDNRKWVKRDVPMTSCAQSSIARHNLHL
jgi:hypothetical protein